MGEKMNHEQVMRQALEALENLPALNWIPERHDAVIGAITALRAALAEPVREPVFEVGFGWLDDATKYPKGTKLYTAPPQRKPLTEEEIRQIAIDTPIGGTNFARAIERAAAEIGKNL